MSKKSSPLVLQVGKYYRTRDGRKAGPVTKNECGFKWGPGWDFAADVEHVSRTYHGSGAYSTLNSDSVLDLVAEWSPSAPSETEPSTRAGVPCGVEASEAAIVEAFNGLVKAGRVQTAVGRNSYTSLPVECEYRLKPTTRTCTLPDSGYAVVAGPNEVAVGCRLFDFIELRDCLRTLLSETGWSYTFTKGAAKGLKQQGCRKGVGSADGLLTWADADALLKFLEET